ncbi:MAG: ABC transporter ATP-binding protein [Dehalococcoidia bacterium]|nr:MAG: ABC transporter ATP-binding protein [Dehalococcoidia bacterium]
MAGLPLSPGPSNDAGRGPDRESTTICPSTLRDGGADGAPCEPLIRLRRVTKSYDTGSGPFTALRDVDLSVPAGVFVAIVGRSGSGKSTLANVITGIDRPTSGEVNVAGTRVDVLSQRQLALWRGRNVGVVFQFFQLLPGLTIAENVVLPMEFCGTYTVGDRLPRALELLDRVGVRAQADKLPSALSGGEQQRAAIARTLANDPPIVVADEPTGNLDSHNAEAVLELFGGLAADGKTVLMVTHERDVSHYADQVVTLVDGRIGGVSERADRPPQKQTGPAAAWSAAGGSHG